MSKFALPCPIYVTRKTAEGLIASYTIPAGSALAALIPFQLNGLVWLVIGLVQAAKILF